MRLWGWVLFYIGGIGSIIRAGVGGDWLLYTLIILASSGVVLIMFSAQHTRKKVSTNSRK